MSLSLCHPGAKHKSMLEGHSTQVRRGRGKLLSQAGHKSKRIGNKGSINIQNKAFHCQVCEIYVNSETQLKQVRTPSLVCVFPLGGAWACKHLCKSTWDLGAHPLSKPNALRRRGSLEAWIYRMYPPI